MNTQTKDLSMVPSIILKKNCYYMRQPEFHVYCLVALELRYCGGFAVLSESSYYFVTFVHICIIQNSTHPPLTSLIYLLASYFSNNYVMFMPNMATTGKTSFPFLIRGCYLVSNWIFTYLSAKLSLITILARQNYHRHPFGLASIFLTLSWLFY